ncbi:MAG: ribonuclease III domain-containing protein, partial [Spirulinaceae cyanobacterium]
MSDQKLRNWLRNHLGIIPEDLHKYKMAVTMQQYEILEFFGDSVLGFIVAEYLVTQYEFIDQPGLFTHIKAKLVKNQNLAQIAKKINLASLAVIPSTSSREQIGEQMLADMLEALLGAIYLDYGLETCQEIIKKLFNLEQATLRELMVDNQAKVYNPRELRKQVEAKVKEENISSVQHKNPVSALQEFLAKKGESPPEYLE